jgi:prephenate dehydrogenase
MSFKHVAIIGMGLIGGSIAKALKAQGTQIATLKGEYPDILLAQESKVCDLVMENWKELLNWADLVILATPLPAIGNLAKIIAEHHDGIKSLTVIDVGSVKKEIATLFQTLTHPEIEFLATHPMAGKESWGFAESSKELFQDAPWVITPHEKNTPDRISQVKELIGRLSANPIEMSPEEHDREVALISHLPTLISCALLEFVTKKKPESLKIAGPGFQSMTRLARGNPAFYREINTMNQEEINASWHDWIEFLRRYHAH